MIERPVIPTSTYRLQFHKGFTFQDARALVPYLHELGISHIYASPIFRATPGSTHGYDVCDHNTLNPEIGTRADFDALSAELRSRGMGLILDFVPNHMGIAEPQNLWWMDVLENGPASPFARYFDIDWRPLKVELADKVLLPVLGDQYGRVLEKGELRVGFVDATFHVDYFSNRFPTAPRTMRAILERAAARLPSSPEELASILTALRNLPARTESDPDKIVERTREKQITRKRLAQLCKDEPAVQAAIEDEIAEMNSGKGEGGFDRLDEFISSQPYRLSSWRVAAEEINYRRFFDINSLAAVRVELPEVFDATHRLLLELIAAGAVDGVRIDHIDGLANPRGYLARLQQSAAKAIGLSAEARPLYLLVEKILAPGEPLRAGWPVSGTTGYEFTNDVIRVLVDQDAEAEITECHARFIGPRMDFHDVAYRSKRLVMESALASEVAVLGHLLNRLSECNRWYRDFTVNALSAAVREVIACFPVYRTYLLPGEPPGEQDVRLIGRAISRARRRNLSMEHSVFEFIRDVLLPPADNPHPVDEGLRAEFLLKFQQCTGPITAKGVEDTAFYIFNRLIALNEVGGEPSEFGETVEAFHRQNAERLAAFPHSMLAKSTHDTKRSEDVRARIAVISEVPREWGQLLRKWATANRTAHTQVDGVWAPDGNEEYLLYQTLLGSWPLEPMDDNARAEYRGRIHGYMEKALHEAKVNSSWIEPNAPWDSAVSEFATRILEPGKANKFLPTFIPFAEKIAQFGAVNSLAQTVLSLTAPGVPDTYQGTELWDLSLVDPDNRRPVDYKRRIAALQESRTPPELLEHWRDGGIKLFTVRTLLRFRRERAGLFASGSYEPVTASGTFSDCCIAFERAIGNQRILVVVPRLATRVGFPPVGGLWKDTVIAPGTTGCGWRDLFTGRRIPGGAAARLSEILADLPFGVLEMETEDLK
jgi:(1->4)-alpha-D-glucan 1-alpha-D-glucosylmutase